MDNRYRIQLEKYLDKKLSGTEAENVEKTLKTDTKLQKSLTLYAVGINHDELIQPEDYDLKEESDSSKSSASPYKKWLFVFVLSTGVIAALLYWFGFRKTPLEIAAGSFTEAVCATYAGTQNIATEFEQASRIYCQKSISASEQINQLQQMKQTCQASFCPSRYYLAHALLKDRQYRPAVAELESCLNHFDILALLPETRTSEKAIRLNLIYARFGAGDDPAQLRTDLEKIKSALSGDLQNKARLLEAALNS